MVKLKLCKLKRLATAHSCGKIIDPLLSRFLVLKISEYTFEEFREIAVSRLTKEKVDKFIASVIAEKVWKELGSSDIRDALKVGRLAANLQNIESVIRIMKTFHTQTRPKGYFCSSEC